MRSWDDEAAAKRIYRRGRAFEQVLGRRLQRPRLNADPFQASAIGLKPAIGLPALTISQRKGKVNETG
ncbi:MAG: hypothetical protein ACKOEW_11705 [Methylocystis sp.]